ncbi:UNVERIFIED_CONTAM: hypothetical protein HDU68_012211 [Siphonaria sp. JEL0065]|nr:hypothetical protein HDU68_012211 [Siphonaria sp. JEL0065]
MTMSNAPWQARVSGLAASLAPSKAALLTTIRGADVVAVAVEEEESRVKLVSLKAVKAKKGLATTQLLNPTVPFQVKLLQLNQNGSLLALAGEFQIAVMVLPPTVKASNLLNFELARDVNVRTVGDVYHAQDTSRIVKVSWHPMSDGFVHLMVLTADGCLRMYDINTDADEPEQTAYFSDQSEFMSSKNRKQAILSNSIPVKSSSTPKRRGVFGIDLDEREAVSFVVGAGGSSANRRSFDGSASEGFNASSDETFQGWSPCTVYGLMKSGDVFAVCPFVPFKSVWSLTALTNLKALNESEWNPTTPTNPFNEKQFYWRNRWLEEAISSTQASVNQELPTDSVKFVISRSLSTKLKPMRQGPVLVLQESEDEDCGQEDFATDLFTVEAGVTSVFVSAHESKILRFFVEVAPAVAKWEVPEDEPEPNVPTFLFYEQLPLNSSSETAIAQKKSSIQIHEDPNHTDSFFVLHSGGVQLVCLRPWLSKLVQPGFDLGGLFGGKEHISSTVQTLVDILSIDSSIREKVASFAVVGDVLLGYSFLICTASNQLYCRPLSLRPITIPAQPSKLIQPPPSSTSSKLKIIPYTQTTKPAFDIPTILTTQSPLLVTPTSGADAPLDETLIRAMASKIVSLRTSIAQLKKAGSIIQDQVQDVQTEAIHQNKALESYIAAHKTLEREGQVLTERLDGVKGKLEDIGDRVDGVLQLLMDATQPELSDKEVAFMDELKEMGSRIRSMLKPRLGQIQRQKNVLKVQAEEIRAKYPDVSRNVNQVVLGTDQVKRMNDALAFEYKLLTETWKKVEDVKDVLEQ